MFNHRIDRQVLACLCAASITLCSPRERAFADVCQTWDSYAAQHAGQSINGIRLRPWRDGFCTVGRDKQTWEWDGKVWNFRGFGGPPWISHELVYDSIRHVIVAFGSDQFAPLGETWGMERQRLAIPNGTGTRRPRRSRNGI
jgi:hypothetical protein